MDIVESKTQATVNFWGDASNLQVGATQNALVHLFEHQYNDRTLFWYGALDLSCGFDEFPLLIRVPDALRLRIRFQLDDGRHGSARMLNAMQQGSTHNVRFFGFTALSHGSARPSEA